MRRRQLLGSAAGLGLALASGIRPGRSSTASVSPVLSAVAPGAWPRPLQSGSRIGAVAPGTWLDPADGLLSRLRQRCAEQGWQLIAPDDLRQRWRWFSANDAARSSSLRRAWLDADLDALFCVGAGWGSARVLEQGWSIPSAPRWCVGFSDCSALLLAQLAAGGSGGIHGWFGGDASQWQRLVALLEGQAVAPLQGRAVQGGIAIGPLVVTNLTIATSLIGTPWLPDLRGAVLVLEDTGEAPYRIDRQLTQWRTSGLLRAVAGIALGRFSWPRDDVLPGDFTMEEILLERLAPLNVPMISSLPVGHGVPNLALPQGRRARIDGGTGRLELL
ncbi:MAG: LD-carboxypeptidase [Synechococcaceae bacterium WB4_1_0192]|jgi:muramoyltetrapeptide carboxypeptidase|nr:LD-carboxypeptidase [Synechococcaceae bacterium WB4_1_0192]